MKIFVDSQTNLKVNIKERADFSFILKDKGKMDIRDQSNNKINLLLALCVIIFGAFFFRLTNLQIAQGSQNLYMAEGNRVRLQRILAPRGLVLDKNGIGLTKNIIRYDLEVISGLLPEKIDDRQKVFDEVSRIAGQDFSDKLKPNVPSEFDPIVLKEDIPHQQAIKWQVESDGLSGVKIVQKPLRQYEHGFALSHILGYIGKISKDEYQKNKDYFFDDWIGKTGLENIYEKQLRGKDGFRKVEVNALGRLQRLIGEVQPAKGNDIKLFLDLNLQKKTYEALQKKVEESGNGKGAAIAMNPQNGGIIAMVSLPDYDNNVFVRSQKNDEVYKLFSDVNTPLVNRAIAGVYPIGSTIKPLVASIALQNNVVNENYRVDTPPEISIGDFHFPDWKDHGLTDIRRAIAESNNIFFYMLGGGWAYIKGLGVDRLSRGLQEFGLDELTGIDLVGEQKGLVPNAEWKKKVKGERWYLGDTYHLSIGQGDLLATPMQLLSAIASIANLGKQYEPRLVDDGKVKIKKQGFIDKKNLQIVKEGMAQAVEYGSARALQGIKDSQGQEVQIGAKTGTAQTGDKDKTHGWLTAFAPFDNPEIAVIVLVEEGGEGYQSALPAARDILQEYFRTKN
ncbi:MAG: penicillin-binding protein 2 [Candidatus Berkelbacteria bacterium Licking1014_7]|uniref:Penicillin-binding protein 2 n=1 Tax=Candidatus Berkelbacteria bacterium Licking1014_7 TaxID=2017147 RepID=A0A554LIW5_9BACT|nr:MAG: penicillin-binding protein 2 [Candidatus Berkelbacteria bacterium Licking1014_7]